MHQEGNMSDIFRKESLLRMIIRIKYPLPSFQNMTISIVA